MGSIGDTRETKRHVTVLVTGFGPFQERYPINPSFEITRALPQVLPRTTADGRIIRIIGYDTPIRVAYEEVRELVPVLLDAFVETIDLVLHIGMSSGRGFYTAELHAHRDGYNKNKDLDGETLPIDHGLKYFGDCPPMMTTSLGCDEILTNWNSTLRALPKDSPAYGADCRLSEDAGHYLCDFIYYNSLAWFARRVGNLENVIGMARPVLFLHVPAESDPMVLERGRHVTMALIEAMVDNWCSTRRNRLDEHVEQYPLT